MRDLRKGGRFKGGEGDGEGSLFEPLPLAAAATDEEARSRGGDNDPVGERRLELGRPG